MKMEFWRVGKMSATATIARYLNETYFPATREECIEMAEENGAPDDLLEALTRVPDEVYDTIHEVWALVNARAESGLGVGN